MVHLCKCIVRSSLFEEIRDCVCAYMQNHNVTFCLHFLIVAQRYF